MINRAYERLVPFNHHFNSFLGTLETLAVRSTCVRTSWEGVKSYDFETPGKVPEHFKTTQDKSCVPESQDQSLSLRVSPSKSEVPCSERPAFEIKCSPVSLYRNPSHFDKGCFKQFHLCLKLCTFFSCHLSLHWLFRYHDLIQGISSLISIKNTG